MVLSVLLPAIMAGLPESDVASATAAFSFVKTFGYVWGVTIASILFNGVANRNLEGVSDGVVRERLRDGAAYAFASEVHVVRNSLGDGVWGEVVWVYTAGLNTIWWVGLGVSVVSFFVVGLERGLELRQELDTEFGLDDGVRS